MNEISPDEAQSGNSRPLIALELCYMIESSPIPRRGYFYVALAALLWAVSGSSAKFLFQYGITPYELVQMRLTLASVLLFVWLSFRRRDLLRISHTDIFYFLFLGIMGMAMVQFTYFFTISKIKVAAAILLEYLAPVFIALYLVFLKGEKLKRATAFAIIGAISGCYLVVGGYSLDLLSLNRTGVICGICSAVAFAWYSIHGERGMRRYHPWTVLFYALLFAALFWNLAHFFWAPSPPPLQSLMQPYTAVQWGWILYIAILGTVLPFGLYFEGINLIRSTRASITATLEPITAGVISYFFLGETLEPLQVVGGIVVIASVVSLQLRKEYDDSTPDLIRNRSQAASTP